jgi:hypothetical protein
MPNPTTETKQKRIDRVAVEALLVGIRNGLDYLGKEGAPIFEKMGDMMLEYLTIVGEVKSNGKPEEIRQSLQELFTRNRFPKEIPLQFKGSPPAPSIPGFFDYLGGARLEESVRHQQASFAQSKADVEDQVDWVIYEMVIYGMSRGLDGIGAQGQILTNRIAGPMLDHLVGSGRIEASDDPEVFLQHMGDFFLKAGFATKIDKEFEGTPPNALVIKYYHSRYHMNVLPRLRDAGNLLYSCPPCLAAGSILRRSRGTRIVYDVEIRVLPEGEVVLRHKIYPGGESFSEEQAEKTARMMK